MSKSLTVEVNRIKQGYPWSGDDAKSVSEFDSLTGNKFFIHRESSPRKLSFNNSGFKGCEGELI